MVSFSIAIYKGEGATDEGIDNVKRDVLSNLDAEISEITPEQILECDLSKFDLMIFSGGGASKQGNAIGEKGRDCIRKYLKNGGNYIGICAGAYLATSNFEWSLNIINAETVSKTEWRRGEGLVDLELTKEGLEIFGDTAGIFKCLYKNGPLFKPMQIVDLPQYKVAAIFKSEMADNGSTPGVMVDTPAFIFSEYGKGKVFLFSPHPENTPQLETFLPKAINWVISRN